MKDKEEEKLVPDCETCGNPIFIPEYMDTGICGACTTGEAEENNPFSDRFN